MLAISCEYPSILKLKDVSLDVKLKSPNLFVLFKVSDLGLTFIKQLDPLGLTSISVVTLL